MFTKTAKLGTYHDAPSFETPSSYIGKMSNTNIHKYLLICK